MKRCLVILFSLFSIASFSQVTEVYYPLYVQGVGTSNPSDDRKVPFVCRMTVAGLLPNATYRYYSRFVADTTLATNGQGFYIIPNTSGDFVRVTSATLATAGRYGEFTTNAAGSYTGWYVVEPSSALEFQPGTQLYWRILLNNGAGGGSVATRLNSTNPVTVLGWGTTPTTGTALRSTAVPGFTAKNFVLLYNNEAGTGRPVAGSFIESDGTDNNATTSGYAPFYANSVDAVDKTWGTIIPNNLATGVRRIAQHALTNGEFINGATSSNGLFGATNTASANGGLTDLVINGAGLPLPVTLVSFNASVSDKMVQLKWQTVSEANFSNFSIERSKDGVTFNVVGNRPAQGETREYTFEDVLTPGISYYRLKMIDNDGKFKYSKVVTVNGKGAATGIAVYPNPVKSTLLMSHSKASAGASAEVLTLNGKRMLFQSIKQNDTQSAIDVNALSAGNYILIFRSGDEKRTIQFNKQ